MSITSTQGDFETPPRQERIEAMTDNREAAKKICEMLNIYEAFNDGKIADFLDAHDAEKDAKIAALEARIAELTTMPGDEQVNVAIKTGMDEDREWMPAYVLARALTATRAELAEARNLCLEACERDQRNIQISADLKSECDKLKVWIIQGDEHFARAEAAEKERDELRSNLDHWKLAAKQHSDSATDWHGKVIELRATVERAREALEAIAAIKTAQEVKP